MDNVVDITGLAEILKCKPATLRHIWMDLPHFFIGRGNDLRGARFDANDVLLYLKVDRGSNYERVERQRGKWIAKFRFRGKQYKKQSNTRREAVQWEAEQRVQLGARPPAWIGSIDFHELATAYLEHCKPRMRYNTVRQKAHVYRTFIAFVGGDRPADGITPKQISDYLTHIANDKNNITSNRHRRDLAALFTWGINQEVLDGRNPCQRIGTLPEERSTRYIPPAEDIAKVRLVAERDERDFIECIYNLAARRGEVLRLTWEDINFEQQWVLLHTRKRRGGALEGDHVPMNDTLCDVLKSRWKRRDRASVTVFSFTTVELRQMMPGLCKRAKVKEFTLHAIRHHVASVLNDSGKASMKQIQTILRHRRQATTERYLHSIDHDIRSVAKILNGQSGTPGTHKKAAADGDDSR